MIDKVRNLLEASKKMIHLHLCEQEGIACGQPTFEQWTKAVDALTTAADAIQAIIDEAEKPSHKVNIDEGTGIVTFSKPDEAEKPSTCGSRQRQH
jgi:hypothetical protein